jgi:hypothetical protein
VLCCELFIGNPSSARLAARLKYVWMKPLENHLIIPQGKGQVLVRSHDRVARAKRPILLTAGLPQTVAKVLSFVPGNTHLLLGRNFGLRLYVVEQKAWNENRKYRGSGGVAGAFEERKFS